MIIYQLIQLQAILNNISKLLMETDTVIYTAIT